MANEITESTLLNTIITRLKTQLTLGDERCYPVNEPNTVKVALPGSGDYILQVSLGEPEYPQDEQAAEVCIERIPVEVTIYTGIKLDRNGRNDEGLKSTTRGMFPIRRLVLKALVGYAITGLASLLYASHSSRPQQDVEAGITWQTVYLYADCDLDLQS